MNISWKKARGQLLILNFLSLMIILFLAYTDISLNLVQVNNVEYVSKLTHLSEYVDKVVHSLQEERDASYIYSKTGEKKYYDQLQKSILKTDAKIKKYHDFIDANHDLHDHELLEERLVVIEKDLDIYVQKARTEVNNNVNSDEIFKKYTLTILEFEHLIQLVIERSAIDDYLYKHLEAYFALFKKKETTSQLRAKLSTLISSDLDKVKLTDYIKNLHHELDIFQNDFTYYSSKEEVEKYDLLTSSSDYKTMEEILYKGIKNIDDLAISFSIEEWFDLTTNVLNQYGDIDIFIIQNVEKRADKLNNESQESIIITSILVTFMILLITFVAYWVSKNIAKNINNIEKSISAVATNIQDGLINERIDTETLGQDFITIGENLNSMLDKMSGPFHLTMEYINEISSGQIPEEITEDYKGEFKNNKDNINKLIKTLRDFNFEMNQMIKLQKDGEIDSRINEDIFEGPFKVMSIGLNKMVDDFVLETQEILSIVDEIGNGNFDVKLRQLPGKKVYINNSIDKLNQNLNSFKKELSCLIDACNSGELSVRAEYNIFEGDWQNLVIEINNILDAVTIPINETVKVLENMSNGDLTTKMTGQFNGDHAKLKNSINRTIELMPFDEAKNIFELLSDGNFTNVMSDKYQGDAKEFSISINKTIYSIEKVLSQVVYSIGKIEAGANQLSENSAALSQGASEQAASLEEISASTNDISNQTKDTAQNAAKAENLSKEANIAAQNGNEEMLKLEKAMEDITASSKQISKIITAIDEIAFQTNLLALNAAVEAARAGRHGKGFAVVAEEVRNLASRASAAASETSELIEKSITSIELGVELTNKTGTALKTIHESSSSVAEIVLEISRQANEQATAIAQIDEGLTQIDTVTQQNTAAAEETSAASDDLNEEAQNLKRLTQRFVLNDSQGSELRESSYSSSELIYLD